MKHIHKIIYPECTANIHQYGATNFIIKIIVIYLNNIVLYPLFVDSKFHNTFQVQMNFSDIFYIEHRLNTVAHSLPRLDANVN